jgi:hypothetical protein
MVKKVPTSAVAHVSVSGRYAMKRSLLAVALASGFAVAALNAPANAATITGELSLTGGNNLDLTAHTITFNFGNPFNVAAETGSFLTLGSGGTVTWRNLGVPIDYNTLATGSNLSCGAGCMFTGSNGAVVTFDLTSESPPVVNGGFLDLSGTGIVTLTGFDPTPGSFFLSGQGGTGVNLTFSSTVSAVPLPAALPLFATGLGALGLLGWRRKRKALAAA